jgi:transposase InsO family protein
MRAADGYDATASQMEQRVQAILALWRGASLRHVSRDFGISRSVLSKLQRRAQHALRLALQTQPRGPRRPANRLAAPREEAVLALCHRHPTWSATVVRRHCGGEPPSLRAIQRLRRRHGLVRLPQRPPATHRAVRLSPETRQQAVTLIGEKPYLGATRLTWELQNTTQRAISPATMTRLKRKVQAVPMPPPSPAPQWHFYERRHPHSLWHGDFLEKVTLSDCDQTAYQLTLLDDYSRGYVFCDLFVTPDIRTTIHALIAAMRQWHAIPTAVMFDHGAAFTGRLLTTFCHRVGIRLIHTAVRHPQTNGKLERAFRDDMRDFYTQQTPWLLAPLRQALPAYVHYRNYVRGHQALQGHPAITRLREHTRLADPEMLAQLETYAAYELGHKSIPATGCIRLFGREAHVGMAVANRDVVFWESLDGLEVRYDGHCLAVLREYRTFRQMLTYREDELPPVFYFEPCEEDSCPRIAVAY